MKWVNGQFLLALALAALVGLGSGAAIAGNAKVSGSIEASYAQRHALPAGDQEGHVIMLTEAVGSNSNTSGSHFLDRFAFSAREIVDLVQGNGPSQGYVVFKRGGEEVVVRIKHMVTTTLNDDGTPNTRFKGEWSYIKGSGRYEGLKGDGTYTGYFTAEDRFRVDWKGWHNKGDAFAMAR